MIFEACAARVKCLIVTLVREFSLDNRRGLSIESSRNISRKIWNKLWKNTYYIAAAEYKIVLKLFESKYKYRSLWWYGSC